MGVLIHLERVQLVVAQVGSLGSLPQFDHTGLPELCVRVKTQFSDRPFTAAASPGLTHAAGRELSRGGFQEGITAAPASHRGDQNTPDIREEEEEEASS